MKKPERYGERKRTDRFNDNTIITKKKLVSLKLKQTFVLCTMDKVITLGY